jgi:hypothetical protein
MEELFTDPRGIKGMLQSFRKVMDTVPKKSTIVYSGLPHTCTPIIEFLLYVLRDSDADMYYVPYTHLEEARSISLGDYSMEIGEPVELDTKRVDVIVLLGGLAMPNKCEVEDVKRMIDAIRSDDTVIIGVCFMNMFERAGWTDTIPFDFIENSEITTSVHGKNAG